MAVVSVRIPEELRDKLRELGFDVSKEVKKYLTWLATKEDSRKKLQELEKLVKELPVSKRGTAEKLVREDRDSH
ncbi:MAG: hypothetical protein HYY67_08675 [Thaumarchaeota archaeon]|nr:hypothetical protein [Nitrososphaerota archaeon]